MTRATALTPELAHGIVTLIANGVHPAIAAGAFGVARSTYYDWIQRGEAVHRTRATDPVFVAFADDVRKAEYQAESTLVGMAISKVRTTADAVMLLERRFAERWQRREEVTVNLRREADRIAAETGLDADTILAEAEAVLAANRK